MLSHRSILLTKIVGLVLICMLSACVSKTTKTELTPALAYAKGLPIAFFTLQKPSMHAHLQALHTQFNRKAWLTFIRAWPYKKVQSLDFKILALGNSKLLDRTSTNEATQWSVRQLIELSWPPYDEKHSRYFVLETRLRELKIQKNKFVIVDYKLQPNLPRLK